MAEATTVLLPMKLDCLILNEKVCSPGIDDAKIAPITQPNYTLLRYDEKYISSDILRQTDLHGTGKLSGNSRITDLGTGSTIAGRVGVYVHWMIPRPYRAGTASADSQTQNLQDKGQLPPEPAGGDNSPGPAKDAQSQEPQLAQPQFLDLPTRWLVVRHIDRSTIQPEQARNTTLVPDLEAWVVESDHQQLIDDLPEGVDLQVDVSPYVASASVKKPTTEENFVDGVNIAKQAEVFIGSKWPAAEWEETSSRQRVKLNLANSSNQLFADFQPHNSNVFSIVDPLTYVKNGKVERITSATVSYSVIGWHVKPEDDIFSISKEEKLKVQRGARLAALNMVLRPEHQVENEKWAQQTTSTRILCHGSKYDVKWDLNNKPVTPADDFCKKLMKSPAPISVGTSPLNSILAFVHSFENKAQGEIKALMTNLLKIEALLIAREEGVEPERAALKGINNASFRREDGGKRYFYGDQEESLDSPAKPGTMPTTQSAQQKSPSPEQLEHLRNLNHERLWTDTMALLRDKSRWDMFATWWSWMYDRGRVQNLEDVEKNRKALREKLDALVVQARKSDDTLKDTVNAKPEVQTSVQDPFFQPNDPTLLVASVDSSWPYDYLEKLLVRLDTQTIANPSATTLDGPWKTFSESVLEKVIPDDLVAASRKLFEEFSILRTLTDQATKEQKALLPLYHDREHLPSGEEDPQRWRDRWNNVQPFFPLYLEWEVEYIHIPSEYWRLKDFTNDDTQESTTRYVIDVEKFLGTGRGKHEGSRLLSGRALMLPQPTFSLESKIKALFSQMPEPLLNELLPVPPELLATNKDLKPADIRDTMMKQLRQLPLLSAPLSGFADHLLTKLHGTHVKPNNKLPTGEIIPIETALRAVDPRGSRSGFDQDDLRLIDSESALTPYSSVVQYGELEFPVFKPVTHGQFRFTKLNIIDKFGQAIHALDPQISASARAVYPCTSEYFAPQRIFDRPGAEPPASDSQASEYIQIPPQINQLARLNASFVQLAQRKVELKPDAKASEPLYWQTTTDWESPVWGWVVINYADYGLQFFLSDGTFYREVRVGGPMGTLASPEWLPFPPPSNNFANADPKMLQLQRLIKKLSESAAYLVTFVGMIDSSMASLLPAPSAYAEHMSAAVGRPLALVNMGWSLELATPPAHSWILGERSTRKPAVLGLPGQDTQDMRNMNPRPQLYEFEIQLGSREKQYDGLVGYFPAKSFSGSDEDKKPKFGDALDLDSLYTYYAKPKAAADGAPLVQSALSEMYEPFYFDPLKRSAEELRNLHSHEQHVFGAIIDPFASVHAFSSILPIKELRLPTRIWQEAFAKMTTFFRLGPLLISVPLHTEDAKGQVALDEVVPSKIENGPNAPKASVPILGVPLPVTTLGDWAWLQPYFHPEETDPSEGTVVFKQMKLDKVDQRARFEDGPYTAIEGYLQLRKPVGGTTA